MGNLEITEQENRTELVLEMQAEVFLREGRKWAKFLAIIGFIFMGLAALGAISIFALSGAISPYMSFPMGGIAVFYLVLIGIYFFPIYYLLQFSNKAKEALDTRNTQSLTEAMRLLKSHYKFIGIMFIVMLALYLIVIIGAIAFGVSQGF